MCSKAGPGISILLHPYHFAQAESFEPEKMSTAFANCQYIMKKGPKKGVGCINKTVSGDYCSLHFNSTRRATGTHHEDSIASQQVPEYVGCRALTSRGPRCKFQSVSESGFCKRHLKSGPVPESDPSGNNSRNVPKSSLDNLSKHKEIRAPKPVEEVVTVPICSPTIVIANCGNLCTSCGRKINALSASALHAATGFGHVKRLSEPPTAYCNSGCSSRSPAKEHPSCSKSPPREDIAAKLKVCNPEDFGMPKIIPINSNLFVWNRWWHVKESLLGPQAGLGLFAVYSIPKDVDLFPFIGPEYDAETFHEIEKVRPEIRCYALKYWNRLERPRKEIWIDGGTQHSNLAGYINGVHKDPRNLKPNVDWENREDVNHSFVMTVSVRTIPAGGELYAAYDWQGATAFVQKMKASSRHRLPEEEHTSVHQDLRDDKRTRTTRHRVRGGRLA